jgi:ribosomal peptide maturation radical SAM protein 1
VPNLAIEELAERARGRGHRVVTLHAALLQTTFFRDDLVHGLGAQGCFSPLYFDLDWPSFAEDLVDAVYADFAARNRFTPEDREAIVDRFFVGIAEAARTVERVLDAIPRHCDLIGLSVGFDSQKLPAAVLARRLRERGETATIVVGGTGTDEEMGAALLERFVELDMVLQGEADESWPMLLDRLAAGADVGDVPGLVHREGSHVVGVPEKPFDRSFVDVRVPDYDAFIEQRARSEHTRGQLCLLVETSRGCWWGRKHHCTFCGIRSVDQDYRRREPDDVVALLTTLWDRYHPSLLYCTDAISPATHHATAWPALHRARAEGRPWRIFYETKSNLKRRELARMAAAGILRVQPGIESFATNCLRAMDKGASGLQQVAFIKWAHAYDILVNYGIISGMPPERPADLRSMTALAAKL